MMIFPYLGIIKKSIYDTLCTECRLGRQGNLHHRFLPSPKGEYKFLDSGI